MLSLFSCGTKKKLVQVETLRTGVYISDQKNVSKNAIVIKEVNRTVITPIDPTKPMVHNGKETKNAKIEESTEKTKVDTSEKDTSKKEASKDTAYKKRDASKETTKPNPWPWVGIVVTVCFALYFARRWVNAKKT